MPNKQAETWLGKFGKEYTDRSIMSPIELDIFYKRLYGETAREMLKPFFSQIPTSSRILEVGCNVGNQLRLLQDMGYGNLYGIELQPYAVELSRQYTRGINIIQGDALDIPFKDEWFECVFTCGLLTHIVPRDIHEVVREMERCTRKWIFGMEPWAKTLTEINYRGNRDLMWKDDYPQEIIDWSGRLVTAEPKPRHIKFKVNEDIDVLYLLEKS